MTDLLTVEDVIARVPHLTPGTLANWRYQGRGPKWARIGKRVYYRAADLEQWINDQFEATR